MSGDEVRAAAAAIVEEAIGRIAAARAEEAAALARIAVDPPTVEAYTGARIASPYAAVAARQTAEGATVGIIAHAAAVAATQIQRLLEAATGA